LLESVMLFSQEPRPRSLEELEEGIRQKERVGPAMQEIEVKEGGSVLASGATCDLGNVTVGERATRTITVTKRARARFWGAGSTWTGKPRSPA